MPRPRTVNATGGTVAFACMSAPTVVRQSVVGVPAATADEAYALEISADGVRIVAPTERGERWARQTLAQLVKLADGRVPCCRIIDWPALRWRGFMLDTARNFMDVKGLEELLDHMSAYKLNLFHWHLTENFAWRLESKRFPVLTEKGYYDSGNVRHRGKFYTQADFVHVVDYAAARGITVMPELDFPGHAHAFRKAFGYRTMRDSGVTETVTALLTELAELVPPAKMPFIHLGGDEVWDEHEKCAPGAFTAWAAAVSRTGHKVVSWDPGEGYDPKGPRVGMIWGEAQGGANATFRADWFDARGWYIEDFDPFELLPSATYSRPFRDDAADPRQIGAVFCAWHDASVGLPYARAWRNQPVWPACVLFGDLYWHGKPANEFDPRYCRRLPPAGDPLLNRAIDLERRTIAHRDRIFADDPHPFHFLRQTDQRWRLTDAKSGRLIARDIAQATITPFFSSNNPNNYFEASNGCVIAETWIRSQKDQTVGAWIGMTHMDRDHGRVRGGQGTPKRGEWNRWGGTVELNGEKIAGPDWKLPDLRPGKKDPELPRNDLIDEIPFEDEEYYMREPLPVRLREGWNHVKLTMPMPKTVVSFWSQQWSATFVPVLGPTGHPREVPDLLYSCDPPSFQLENLQGAIDRIAAQGGGKVVVTAGRHVTGGLQLKSNVELHLERGAVLEGAPRTNDYPVVELPCSEGRWMAVVMAVGQTNVAVTGEGEIYGNGTAFPQPANYANLQEGWRPRGLFFGNCTGVKLEDFKLRDSGSWGCVVQCCRDVEIRGLKIDNHANANNDGIDIEAFNAVIADCDIDAGDDGVCLKSNNPDFVSGNVLVTNVTVRSHCAALKIGTATHGIVTNVTFSDCRIEAPRRDFTDRRAGMGKPEGSGWFWSKMRSEVFPPTKPGDDLSLSAISIECVDGGWVEDVVCRNISIDGTLSPIFVRGGTRTGRPTGARPGRWHILRNVLFENITGRSRSWYGNSVTGVEGCRVQGVTLRKIRLTYPGGGEMAKSAVKPIPEMPGAGPGTYMFKTTLPASALWARHVDGLVLDDVQIEPESGTTDARERYVFEDVNVEPVEEE